MRLLVVGKLNGQLSVAVKMAMNTGAKVSHVETTEAATHALRAGQGADLMMVEYTLDIAGLIATNESERIRVPVVACGVDADPMRAAAAIKAGAKEFIPLPPDAELIAAVLAAVTDDNRPMIVRDPAMENVIRLADQVAPSEASILITGESGSGKEVMARYVHAKSRRSKAPFISVNCAAIPENLLESELFGHEAGAFTGATRRHAGRFEQADGGTLFLDEIGDMPLGLQTRLLRVLAGGEFYRVGGRELMHGNVRIVAATHQDLDARVAAGQFRADLKHRLDVVRIELPSLRDRRSDIPLLARHFLAQAATELNLVPKRFSRAAMKLVEQRDYPGNVRELENLCRRLAVIAPGVEIQAGDLGALPSREPRGDQWTEALRAWAQDALSRGDVDIHTQARDALDRTLLQAALLANDGHRQHAAAALGVGRNTLTRKLGASRKRRPANG